MKNMPPDPKDSSLREHLAWQLGGGYAHVGLRDAVDGLSVEDWGRVPPGASHSVWQIVRHIEICLRDLIDYTVLSGHVSPDFPDGLWPEEPAPPGEAAIAESMKAIDAATAEFVSLVRDPSVDLTAPIAHASGRTVLRQVLIAIDHAAYHVGQITTTRAALGA